MEKGLSSRHAPLRDRAVIIPHLLVLFTMQLEILVTTLKGGVDVISVRIIAKVSNLCKCPPKRDLPLSKVSP